MINGKFERLDRFAYARAQVVMSTQSATGFEWSVKLIGASFFTVGIASKLEPDKPIDDNDQEAIVYYAYDFVSDIRRGSTAIYSDLKKVNSGDVIRFKFQPDAKKLIIHWVRNRNSSSANLLLN